MVEVMEGEDALLDSLVKTATQGPSARTTPRERKRSRHADRKSCECCCCGVVGGRGEGEKGLFL
ncbi:FH1/FH2 domain-containing protein 3 [Portunus trituberculatus]|uniref:FH1/FH2 domain-containing protein 3 n=1 Tax=Portunus trituberculatus TaxID=210409 RepID=A0A5B7K370_PORTR|nr:FH1/FH2 domain-containing protein 3 [Portunus trituberculatus]